MSMSIEDDKKRQVKYIDPREEWEGMPEFVQEKQEPFSKIIIRFDNEEDLNEFSEMIGQKLTPKTKSIWHPKLVRGQHSNKRYIDGDTNTDTNTSD